VQNRNSWVNAGQPIDSNSSVIPITNDCFREGAYIRFCSAIDQNPHGAVHVDVGTPTNMGTVPTAAQDPVFWVHHCEIDRLWESWNRHGNKSNTVWPDRSFVYADAAGNAVLRKCKDADRVALLDYEYDNYYVPPFPPPPAPLAGPLAAALSVVHETTRAVGTGSLQLSTGQSRVTLQPPPAIALPGAQLNAALVKNSVFQLGEGRQLYLVLGDIEIPHPIGTGVNIYLDLPEGQKGGGPTNEHYVGTINFFGVPPNGPDASHESHNHQVTLNVTEVAKALDAKGLLTPAPTVTAEPAVDIGGTAAIRRVTLVAG
jgi:tyrosinase